MNTLTRTILAAATLFAVLGSAAREPSPMFGTRNSGSGRATTRSSGFTARETSRSAAARPSFGVSAPVSRAPAAVSAPRVQSAPPRISTPAPSVTRTPSAPAVTRQAAPQPARVSTPRPTTTWQRPASAPSVQTRPASPAPAAVTRVPAPQRTVPTVTRPAAPSVATPRAPVITRPAAPSVATPRAPAVMPPAAVTRADPSAPVITRPAAPSRTRPEIPSREPVSAPSRQTPSRTATISRTAPPRTVNTPRIDRDAISRLPSAAERVAATRLARPDEPSRLFPSATRGTAALQRGGTSGALRPLGGDSRLAYAPSSLRSNAGRLTTRDASPLSARRALPERTKPVAHPAATTSRYRDGRYSVYTPPDRHAPRHVGPYRPDAHRPDRHHHDRNHSDRYDRHRHHSSFYLGLAIGSGWYAPGWSGPAWYGPAYYPASGFSFSWSNHRYGLSFWNYRPVYATPYYDSWNCGGWGFSSLYYGGWHSGWYGGVSYIYNPWPVYRTTYFYDPVPVVTRTETVYVTQPAAQPAAVYEEPQTYAAAPAAPPDAYPPAAPASVTAPILPQPVPNEPSPARSAWAWDDVPAVERVDAEVSGYYCPGQDSYLSDYPYGAEYAVTRDAFDLSLSFVSYADSLDPETIWFSYAGLDRWDALESDTLYAGSAANAY